MINLVFVTDHLNMGGIEKALLNIIHAVDHKDYKVHLLLFSLEGKELMALLPNDVEVHHLKPESLSQCYKRGGIPSFIHGVVARALLRLTAHDFRKNSMLLARLCRFPTSVPCDILIAFSEKFATLSWVSRQINEPRILFIHQSWYGNQQKKLLRAKINRFQKVICVSDAAKRYIGALFPGSVSNIAVIHNFIGADLIRSLAIQPVDTQVKHFCILTVARLQEEKGCQFIPLILRKVLDCGLNVYWYIIGDGRLYSELTNMVEKMGLQEHLIILGKKANPYPYINKCDIYVQPSINEGYGIALQEARVLRKAVVAADIPPFRELVSSGVNGTLAPLKHPLVSNEQFFNNPENRHVRDTEYHDVCIDVFADAIIDLITDQEKRDRYTKWLDSHPVDTDHNELLKLDKVFRELHMQKQEQEMVC